MIFRLHSSHIHLLYTFLHLSTSLRCPCVCALACAAKTLVNAFWRSSLKENHRLCYFYNGKYHEEEEEAEAENAENTHFST